MWRFYVKMIGTTGEFLTEYDTIEEAINKLENILILGFEAFLKVERKY